MTGIHRASFDESLAVAGAYAALLEAAVVAAGSPATTT